MMGRRPVDLAAMTRDVKTRCEHAATHLDSVAQIKDPIFPDPRMVWLSVTLSIHELEAAASIMKRAWWP